MRNKFLILLITSLLVISSKSKAQLATPPGPDLQEKAAGYELVKASSHFYTGALIVGGGILLDAVGAVQALSGSGNEGFFVAVGGLTIITGFVFMIESNSHIGRAGKILMQRNDMTLGPTRSGIGLSVQF